MPSSRLLGFERSRWPAWKIVIVYGVVAQTWITVSDWAVARWMADEGLKFWVGLLKGWGFVAVTAALLYVLIAHLARENRKALDGEAEAKRSSDRTAALLKALADNSPDAIFAKDRAGRYLMFSQGAQALTGVRESDVLGCDDYVLFPTEQALQVRANDEMVMVSAAISTFDETIMTVRGPRDFLAIKGPLHDSAGDVIGLYGVSRDITELRLNAAELRLREAEFRSLAEQLPAIVYRASRDVMARTLYISPQVKELGYTPEEWLADQEAWHKAIHPDDRDRVTSELQKGLESGEEVCLTYRLKNASGRYRHYRDTARVVDAPGGIGRCVQGVMIDVTELTESAERLEHLARRASAQRELPQLAEAMSEQEFLQRGLEVVEDLTASEVSFIHFVNEAAEEIELVTWSRRTLDTYCSANFDRHYPVSHAGIWADALRQRRTVVFNDYPGFAAKHGLPDGHAALTRFLSVPVIEGGKVVALLGVGNKSSDYGDLDAETVLLLAADLWRVVQRRHAQLKAAHLSRVIDQSMHEVYLFDSRSLQFVAVNDGARRNLGYSRDEFHSLTPLDIKPEISARQFEAELAKLRSGKQQQVMLSTVHRRKDGSTYPVEVRIEQTPDDPPLFIANVMDITHRRELEDKVRRLAQAVEQSTESIVITDLEGAIQYANPNALAATGYTMEELLGSNPRVLQSGKTPKATYDELWSNLTSGKPWKGLFHNRRKDGSDYTEFAVISPIRDESGRITNFLAVKEDVTEKRRMGEELDRYRLHLEELVLQRTEELSQAKRAAELANEAKSTFLAAMSHEIRTPMNGVVGMVDLLMRTHLNADQTELSQTIRDSALALLGIINDILDFSKIEAARLALDLEPVDLPLLISTTCKGLQAMATARGVRIECRVDPALPRRVRSDPVRLRQILNNLLGNAIKFSAGLDRPGEVSVEAHRPEDGFFEVSVIDNGIGMSDQSRARIFEPFEQAEASTTRRYGGTGLGLAICSRLVGLFGGSIVVQSAQGVGSTFIVRLPCEELPEDTVSEALPGPSPVPNAQGTAEQPALRGLSKDRSQPGVPRLVLVAEDNEINQRVIRRQLDLLGYQAEVVDDGLKALECYRQGRGTARYALLLTDLHMPRMDGYELARAIRRESAQVAYMPIVALTANAVRGEADRCRAEGMDDYLTKPIELGVLASTLQRWIAAAPAVPGPSSRPEVAPIGQGDLAALPIHDPSVLTRLVGGDQHMADELLQDFRSSMAAAIRELEVAQGSGDLPTCKAVAHRLKSSARSVGAIALGAAFERLEWASLDGVGVAAAWGEVRSSSKAFEREAYAAPETLAVAVRDGLRVGDRPGPQVLVVDDDEMHRAVTKMQLLQLGVRDIHTSGSGTDALEYLRSHADPMMLLLLDLAMPDMDGVQFMRHLEDDGYSGALSLVSGADTRVLDAAAKVASVHQLHVLPPIQKPVTTESLANLLASWDSMRPTPRRDAAARLDAEQLRAGIEGRQMVLHYQPKVSLRNGRLVGVEALVRWEHPVHALIYPDRFIGLAEAAGLIDALTAIVLETAVDDSRAWSAAGLSTGIAVNVAMDSLSRLDFPERVESLLTRRGVPKSMLTLEVTESQVMRDLRSQMDILTRLRLKGISLSIDDFGTGHSSLVQLRDIPFVELKIDRGFVHRGAEDATLKAIFHASLDLAHDLGMQAVAEGVEDLADLGFVRGAGCDVAQGYVIARPMAAEQLVAWEAAWNEQRKGLGWID